MKSLGIHHITAIASDPKKCNEFYTQILGLRLVKKSVNQDQVEAYHLFFGDKTGEPGMDLTFFTFPGIGKGRNGVGAVTKISLAVPVESLEWWRNRFEEKNVSHEKIETKFGNKTLIFYDFDNQCLELVGLIDSDINQIEGEIWESNEVKKTHAIRSFYSATLTVSDLKLIEPVISDLLGFDKVSEENNIILYQNKHAYRGNFLEVKVDDISSPVWNAAGTVHHIAFQVEDENHLKKLKERVWEFDLQPTDLIDRYYFKSVYFRTKSGILFELATNGPGFTVDEDEKTLGQKLALPPFLENYRSEIERGLEPI